MVKGAAGSPQQHAQGRVFAGEERERSVSARRTREARGGRIEAGLGKEARPIRANAVGEGNR